MQKVMKAVFVVMLFGSGAIYLSQPNERLLATFQEQMTSFEMLVESESLKPEEWRIRAKGKTEFLRDEQMFFDHIDVFAHEQSSFVLDSVEDMSHGNLRAVFVRANDDNTRQEKVTFMGVPTQERMTLTTTYEHRFDAEQLSLDKQEIMQQLQQLNLSDAELYVQISAETSASLAASPYETAQKWARKLGAMEKEALVEETNASVSAYNDEWHEGVPLKANEEMNVQIALRQSPHLGGAAKVTLGTPIITTEY